MPEASSLRLPQEDAHFVHAVSGDFQTKKSVAHQFSDRIQFLDREPRREDGDAFVFVELDSMATKESIDAPEGFQSFRFWKGFGQDVFALQPDHASEHVEQDAHSSWANFGEKATTIGESAVRVGARPTTADGLPRGETRPVAVRFSSWKTRHGSVRTRRPDRNRRTSRREQHVAHGVEGDSKGGIVRARSPPMISESPMAG